ncbi:MAG TPA: hypothetical protein PK048_04430 [Candidatus Absconditabacterales bacterium]|nr:hypothetical protein [Candidatus Absconditabacterales bacterium]
MKKTLFTLFTVVIGLTGISSFAMSQPITVSTTQADTGPAEKSIRIDPDYPVGGNITYNIDALNIKEYVTNNKPSIMKVKCDGKAILKTLGIGNAKVVSVGVQEGDFTYNYDFNGCGFWANRTMWLQATDSIADADAIKMAKDFLAKSESLNFFKKYLGEPIISYRNFYDTMGVLREGKSYSSTVIFPIKIAGKPVYQIRGDVFGLMMEVNNKGINSVSAQLLPFGFLKADSYKLGADDMIALLKKGGNNPYYTYNMSPEFKAEVKATSYEKVWIFTQKYPPMGGNPALYLSSGIRVKTDKQIDNGPGQEKRDYVMNISDYKIGNNPTY